MTFCARLFATATAFAASLGLLAAPATVWAQAGAGLIVVPMDLGDPMDAFMNPPLAEERFIDTRRRAADAVARSAAAWVSPLRPVRLSNHQRGALWRFAGEHHREVFSLHVADTALSDRLRIATMSTVNVLPERSAVHVAVNGTAVGTFRLEHFDRVTPVDLQLPPGLLREGRNEVTLDVQQHHRIFCGPEASWALWTDFDLAQSGLVVDPADMVPGAEGFMMGLAAQAGLAEGLEVRGSEGLGAQRLAWVGMLAGRLGNAIGGEPLALRFTSYWSLAAPSPARARVTFIPGADNNITFRIGADGAHVMVIEYAEGAPPGTLPGLDAHMAALPISLPPPLIEVAREVSLAEIGFRTERYAQRYVQRELVFRLPDDWLVLTAAKARLRLDYIYAGGLPHGSVLILSVNGTPIRMLPLWGDANRYITRFPIDFEARLLTPGANVLSYEMLIPGDPPDMPCSGTRGAVLEIHQNSTLSVPFSPRMHLPDMGLTFNTLAPDSMQVNDLSHRDFDDMDRIALAAALSRAPAGARPGVLHLIALDDLGAIPLGRFSVDRRLLEEVLLVRPTRTPGGPGSADAMAADPFFRAGPEARASRAAMARAWDWVAGHADDFLQWVSPRVEDRLNTWLAQQRGQAVLLQLDLNRPAQIWLLRSPDADITAIASAIISARSLGNGPRGQVSVLDHQGRWQNWMAPDRRPVMLERWTLANFRPAMGNVVSARPITFVVTLFFLALISAAVALRLVITTREHET